IRDKLVTGVQTCALPILVVRLGGAAGLVTVTGSASGNDTLRSLDVFSSRSFRTLAHVKGNRLCLSLAQVVEPHIGTRRLMEEVQIGRASCRERGESSVLM